MLPPKRHTTVEKTDIPVPASPSKAAPYTNGTTTASTSSPLPNHHQPSVTVADHTTPPNGHTPHRPPSAASLSHSQASPPSGRAPPPPPAPIPVAPTYHDQPPPSPKLSKFLGVPTSARPNTPDASNRSGVNGGKAPQTPHALAPTTPAAGLGTPVTPSTSITRSLFRGGNKRPTSAVFPPSTAPPAPPGREVAENNGSGPASMIPVGSPFDTQPHQKEKEKDNHKEKSSGTSWFRPKRKESLTSTAAAASAAAAATATANGDSSLSPHFDASPIPDIKPRSTKRPQTGEKLANLNLFASIGPGSSHAPIGASPATPTDSRKSAVIGAPISIPRPRTAPGGGGVSPSSPSKRTSFERSYHAGGAHDPSIPPVPPLPDLPVSSTLAASTSSTLSPLPPPPSAFSNHNRRRSLSKQAGSLFSRPKSGDAAPLLNTSSMPSGSSHGQSLPASPIVQQSQQNAPPPPARHPRRAASVLPLPSASSHSNTGAGNGMSNGYGSPSGYVPGSGPIPRARPAPSADSDRPESMYVISSSAGPSHSSSSSSNRLAMSTSTPPTHVYSQQQQQPFLYQSPPSQSLQMPLVGTSSSTSSRDSGFGLPPSTPPPAPAPAPTASSKRASRKMSLSGTGSFFGGWGKDKDKDRERDRLHKENPSANPPRPPSSNGSQPVPKSGVNAFMGAF